MTDPRVPYRTGPDPTAGTWAPPDDRPSLTLFRDTRGRLAWETRDRFTGARLENGLVEDGVAGRRWIEQWFDLRTRLAAPAPDTGGTNSFADRRPPARRRRDRFGVLTYTCPTCHRHHDHRPVRLYLPDDQDYACITPPSIREQAHAYLDRFNSPQTPLAIAAHVDAWYDTVVAELDAMVMRGELIPVPAGVDHRNRAQEMYAPLTWRPVYPPEQQEESA